MVDVVPCSLPRLVLVGFCRCHRHTSFVYTSLNRPSQFPARTLQVCVRLRIRRRRRLICSLWMMWQNGQNPFQWLEKHQPTTANNDKEEDDSEGLLYTSIQASDDNALRLSMTFVSFVCALCRILSRNVCQQAGSVVFCVRVTRSGPTVVKHGNRSRVSYAGNYLSVLVEHYAVLFGLTCLCCS